MVKVPTCQPTHPGEKLLEAFPVPMNLILYLRPVRYTQTGAVWLVVLLGSLGNASDFQQAQTLLETYFARVDRAAVSAAVVHGNALLWSGTVGTANKALEVAATDDTVFLIASISKNSHRNGCHAAGGRRTARARHRR